MDALSILESMAGFARATDPSPTGGNRLAKIDPAYDPAAFPGTLPKVTFDGEPAVSVKRYAVLSPYWPRPGDRVLMQPIGDTYVISGAPGNATPTLALRAMSKVSATGNAPCNATIADVPGASISVNVTRAGALWVALWVADFTSTGTTPTTGIVRVNVGGVDATEEAHYNQSNVLTGARVTASALASGVFTSTGTKVFKLRALRAGGADDQISAVAQHTSLLVIVAE